jgi:hypothetical protein
MFRLFRIKEGILKILFLAISILFPLQTAFGAYGEPATDVSGFGKSMLFISGNTLMWKGTPGVIHADELGCDRFYRPVESPDGNAVAVWAGADNRNCIVVVNKDGYEVMGPWERAGLPCWDCSGNLWFTAQGELLRNGEYAGQPLSAHHISISPGEERVVFTDRTDRLISMDIASGSVDTLSNDFRYFAPFFINEDEIVSPSLDGGIILFQNGYPVSIDSGEQPVWWQDRNSLIYVKTTDDGHAITSSDIWMWRPEGGSESLGETPGIIEMNPAPASGGILYVDIVTGRTGFREVPR